MSTLSTPKRKELLIPIRHNNQNGPFPQTPLLNESPSRRYMLTGSQTSHVQFLCRPVHRGDISDTHCGPTSVQPPGRNLARTYSPRNTKTKPYLRYSTSKRKYDGQIVKEEYHEFEGVWELGNNEKEADMPPSAAHSSTMPAVFNRIESPGTEIKRPDIKDNTEKTSENTKVESVPTEASTYASMFTLKTVGYVLMAIAFSMMILYVVSSKVTQCTCDNYAMTNLTKLEKAFKEQIFGQHLAVDVTLNRLREYLESNVSFTPLVLSFHGWTGGGKNYMSMIIADNIPNVKQNKFIASMHFPHNPNVKIDIARQLQVSEWIKSNITNCAVNLFVFDEMDKADSDVILGIQETLQELRDHEEKIKTIFIFLSNTGGHAINTYTFEALRDGRHREDITYDELLNLFQYRDDNKEWFNTLQKQGLINAFIPFLPLEKKHVMKCVEWNLIEKGHLPNETLVQHISNEVLYFPPKWPIFSKSGCKRVNTKVDLYV